MTLLWSGVTGRPPPWEDCCVAHDRAYHAGGTRAARLLADRELMQSVSAKGHPYFGILMFLMVRLGGHPLLPFPWRWGYGWKFPRAYSKTEV